MPTVTLSERKSREAARRREAAATAITRLGEYATRHGGRFAVFGSAARGDMRYDSDLDILLDFPPGREADAWTFAETLCEALRIPHDIQPRSTADPRLLERIRDEARVLGWTRASRPVIGCSVASAGRFSAKQS